MSIEIIPDPLLRVSEEIIKRGEQLFGPDGIDEKNKQLVNEEYKGIPESLRPQLDSQTGKVRSEGTFFDPFNTLGWRRDIIDQIVKDGGQNLIDSYDSQSNRYEMLSKWNRTLDGITDDDITKGILRANQKRRSTDPEFQRDLATARKDGQPINSLTTNISIEERAADVRAIKEAEAAIRKMDEGSAALQALKKASGGRVTLAQLETLQTKLKPKQQKFKDDQKVLTSQLKTADSLRQLNTIQGQVAKQNANTEQQRLGLQREIANINRVIAENNQASSDYNAAEDRRLREQQNQMTMQLALMKQDDSRADRAERREDRRYENRQAAIVALIQGLARLGQGFQL